MVSSAKVHRLSTTPEGEIASTSLFGEPATPAAPGRRGAATVGVSTGSTEMETCSCPPLPAPPPRRPGGAAGRRRRLVLRLVDQARLGGDHRGAAGAVRRHGERDDLGLLGVEQGAGMPVGGDAEDQPLAGGADQDVAAGEGRERPDVGVLAVVEDLPLPLGVDAEELPLGAGADQQRAVGGAGERPDVGGAGIEEDLSLGALYLAGMR